jgi:hypothetical protein
VRAGGVGVGGVGVGGVSVAGVSAAVILSGAKDRVGGTGEARGSHAFFSRSFAPLRMTGVLGILCAGLLAAAATRAAAQSFEAVPDTGRITVGEPVAVRLVLRQYEGDALLERVPHPEAALGSGVRLLSVDSMRVVASRRLEAWARIAFYRPGAQTIPAFAIDFRRGAVILHGTVRTAPVPIEIVPVLGAGGGPSLRDIKEIVEVPGPDPRMVAVVAAVLALGAWAFRRRNRWAPVPVPALAVVEVQPAAAPDPFAAALGRLNAIERAGWAAGADVARHYEAVADALRDYLEAAEEIPARERTTTELLWMLPPYLNEGGLRRHCESLFDEADLVKFARRRPDPASAAAFLARARGLLVRWRDAAPAREGIVDAVR